MERGDGDPQPGERDEGEEIAGESVSIHCVCYVMPYMVPVSPCLNYLHCYRQEMGSEQSSAARKEDVGAAGAAQVCLS